MDDSSKINPLFPKDDWRTSPATGVLAILICLVAGALYLFAFGVTASSITISSSLFGLAILLFIGPSVLKTKNPRIKGKYALFFLLLFIVDVAILLIAGPIMHGEVDIRAGISAGVWGLSSSAVIIFHYLRGRKLNTIN
jgi:hypothetical protein